MRVLRRIVVLVSSILAVGGVALGVRLCAARVEPADHWPVGGAEEIARLSERDDVNVLFILVDTLRADRLSAYGYSRETSPNLDRLAKVGLRFGSHLAQSSWTKASMASMWTGFYPARTGIRRYDDVIPRDATMPAEVLREAGFQTIGLYRNGWVSHTFGFEQGFDVYSRPSPRPIPPDLHRVKPTVSQHGTDEDTVASVLEFLRADGRKRWFLYLHFMDLHEYTYDESSAKFGGSYSDIYDNSIHWVDGTIGVLLDYLAEWGYIDSTLIVVASDHGEAFRERGFEGHARFVFRETTEVPLVIGFPFQLSPGRVIQARTRNIDIWPTVLDLLGLEFPQETDGVSLVPEIIAAVEGHSPGAEQRRAFAQLNQNWGKRDANPVPTVALTEGALRYVRRVRRGETVEELFDSDSDPKELGNIAPDRPESVARMRAAADEHLDQQPVWGKPGVREVGEMELNQLRALGYAIP